MYIPVGLERCWEVKSERESATKIHSANSVLKMEILKGVYESGIQKRRICLQEMGTEIEWCTRSQREGRFRKRY